MFLNPMRFLRGYCLSLSLVIALIMSPSVSTSTPQTLPAVALVGATLIDGNGGAPLEDSVILITGNRITRVGRRANVKVPAGARVIDVGGKFIIPGLIDMHVHYDGWMGELFLAHGVTTIKDLGNDAEWCQKMRDAIDQNVTRGPRFFYVGNGIDAPPPVRDHHIGIDSPELGARAVDLLKERGVSAIKLREKVTPELIRAVTTRAHKLGLPVTGHLVKTNAREAALAGIDGLEHGTGIVEATSARYVKPDPAQTDVQRFVTELKGFATIDEGKAEELVRFLAAKKVALIPTLANWWRFASSRRDAFAIVDRGYANNPGLTYVPGYVKQIWGSSALYEIKNADDLAQVQLGLRKVQAYLKPYRAAGGKILAGSDTLISVPGLSLLRELFLMVDAGMTPLEAISIGSRDNAQFLGQGKSLGTVTAGKLADLVVLDANPLTDIQNLQRVGLVLKDGKEVDLTYHPDYANPVKKPVLTRPLWIEKLLMNGKTSAKVRIGS